MKTVLLAGMALLCLCLSSFSPAPAQLHAPESETFFCEDEVASNARLRVYNRTYTGVSVYLDGYYLGVVSYDAYYTFVIPYGSHRVSIHWPTGYYEYFDFSICSGCMHKVWTSDYDG